MQKRGQFFILASVILSVLMFSMAFTTNQVLASSSDTAFFDYADTVEREADYVLDYQVYSDLGTEDLEGFIDILEADFRDNNLGANFMFIYGNNSLLRIKNLGTEGITVERDGKVLLGSTTQVESKIRVGGIGSVGVLQYNSENTELDITGLNPGDTFDIVFNEQVYKFPVSTVSQVIFIIQKDVGEETYVEIR